MKSLHVILCTTLLLTTALLRPVAALDAETQALELAVLCQALPYRCASLHAEAAAPPAPPDPLDAYCTAFDSTHLAVGTAAAVEADQLWATHCAAWKARKDAAACVARWGSATHSMCQGPPSHGGSAPVLPSDFRTRRTLSCTSTRTTTTCTAY